MGSSPFTRRYSGNPILVSFPPPTWMFPFGGFPYRAFARYAANRLRGRLQEIPLGHPRIDACMRLPGAYRSLPRPSSAPKPSYPPAGVVWPRRSTPPSWRRLRTFERGHSKHNLLPHRANRSRDRSSHTTLRQLFDS